MKHNLLLYNDINDRSSPPRFSQKSRGAARPYSATGFGVDGKVTVALECDHCPWATVGVCAPLFTATLPGTTIHSEGPIDYTLRTRKKLY